MPATVSFPVPPAPMPQAIQDGLCVLRYWRICLICLILARQIAHDTLGSRE